MRPLPWPAMLAPFEVRSFRFQFPADLSTSWGIEMENLVLGWYVLVATGSVLLLTVFWALQYLGTLLAPVFGMVGDRIGHRTVLCCMRAVYALLATAVMSLSLGGWLHPAYVFVTATFAGIVRPSDLAMRNALVAETVPADRLTATVGVTRTTSDSARIFGSLAGAGLAAVFGMGPAYIVIVGFYTCGFLLTLKVGGRRYRRRAAGMPPLPPLGRELGDGLGYVWRTPALLAAMWLAFLVNLTAFPLTLGLLPYVAKDVYHIGRTGLGTLIASFALGSLLGSLSISALPRLIRPARMMLMFAFVWYVGLLAFVHMPGPDGGRLALVFAGFAQSLSLVPMAVLLLSGAGERFRGRVMGVRMLAIYGVPIGLLLAGALIGRFGFVATATAYCLIGVAATLAIAFYWRLSLWPIDAPANAK